MVVVGVLVAFAIIGALADSGEETNTVARETTAAEGETTTAEEEEAPSDSAEDEGEGGGECLMFPSNWFAALNRG